MWEPVAVYFFERLARYHTLVLYDKHGTGLSDRDRTDFTLEAELRDLETVIDHLKLKRLALFGDSEGGTTAASYAAKYPRRVTHLVLYATYACVKDMLAGDLKDSFLSLIRAHWGIGSKALTDLFIPGADANVSQRFAHFQRESATPEMAAQLLELCGQIDITDLVQSIRVPTVVIHREQDQVIPFQLGRELASLIPNARFVPLKGNQHVPWFGDCDSVLRAIADFLGDPVPEAVGQAPLTILFTDMEGSTTLTQRIGDDKAQEILRNHNAIIRNAINIQGGKEIKHTGDGVMVSFPSASLAILCAILVQMGLDQYNEANPDNSIRVRIGLNTGEAIAEEQDLFGTAVQLGARICAHAEPSQILVSDVVRQLVAGKDFQFIDRGETILRGFKEPVRLYEISWK
jgi:class 3 adenylate cyclase/predicted esterase